MTQYITLQDNKTGKYLQGGENTDDPGDPLNPEDKNYVHLANPSPDSDSESIQPSTVFQVKSIGDKIHVFILTHNNLYLKYESTGQDQSGSTIGYFEYVKVPEDASGEEMLKEKPFHFEFFKVEPQRKNRLPLYKIKMVDDSSPRPLWLQKENQSGEFLYVCDNEENAIQFEIRVLKAIPTPTPPKDPNDGQEDDNDDNKNGDGGEDEDENDSKKPDNVISPTPIPPKPVTNPPDSNAPPPPISSSDSLTTFIYVLAGALVGAAIFYGIYRYYKKNQQEKYVEEEMNKKIENDEPPEYQFDDDQNAPENSSQIEGENSALLNEMNQQINSDSSIPET